MKCVTFFPNNVIVALLAIVLTLPGCTIFPDTVDDDSASYEASTPSQYDNKNGGFLFFADNGNGVITDNARKRYNKLIDDYKNQFEEEKGVELKEDAGIKSHTDQYGNKVWEIDKQHLTYFALLNQWRKAKRKTDSIWSNIF